MMNANIVLFMLFYVCTPQAPVQTPLQTPGSSLAIPMPLEKLPLPPADVELAATRLLARLQPLVKSHEEAITDFAPVIDQLTHLSMSPVCWVEYTVLRKALLETREANNRAAAAQLNAVAAMKEYIRNPSDSCEAVIDTYGQQTMLLVVAMDQTAVALESLKTCRKNVVTLPTQVDRL